MVFNLNIDISWNRNKLDGKNVKWKSNSKVIKKIQTRIKYDNQDSNVFYVMNKS